MNYDQIISKFQHMRTLTVSKMERAVCGRWSKTDHKGREVVYSLLKFEWPTPMLRVTRTVAASCGYADWEGHEEEAKLDALIAR